MLVAVGVVLAPTSAAGAATVSPPAAPQLSQAWPTPGETRTHAYVRAVYLDLFGRDPDPTGRSTWVWKLSTGVAYAEVANGITYSDEYRTQLIRGAYERFLGRAPDLGGQTHWLQQMRAGQHIEEIQSGFVASDEYWARFGSTPSGWVRGLYQTVLGRPASAAEVQGWVSQLARGMTRRGVARGFLYSTEYLTSVVDGYYVRLLRRSIDPAGRATWVGMIQAGHRDEQIIAAIVSSAEYRAKAEARSPENVMVGAYEATFNLVGRSISADGRWVAYDSARPGNVQDDTDDQWDVFLWDRATGGTTRLSVGADGSPADGSSSDASISADGRVVVFRSDATNLVAGDTNGRSDLFVWDRSTRRTTLLPVDPTASSLLVFDPAVSADGRWVTYGSSSGSRVDIYVTDRVEGTTQLVSSAHDGSHAEGSSMSPTISADGRWIAYQSDAGNLTTDDHDTVTDAFLWDRTTGATTLISADLDTRRFDIAFVPAVSGDGRFVTYMAGAADTPFSGRDVVLWDRGSGRSTSISAAARRVIGTVGIEGSSLSADGRWVVFSTQEGQSGIYAYDRVTGATALVSAGPSGSPPDGFAAMAEISANGKWVTYESSATNLVRGDTDGDTDIILSANPLAPH